MSLAEDDNFLFYHEKFKFQEAVSDVFTRASIIRKCLVQSYQTSNCTDSNDMSCALLKSQLQEYGEEVDKKGDKDINNYAASALALAARCKSESQSWTCQLSEPKTILDKLLKPIQCDSSSGSGCNSWGITERDLACLSSSLQVARSSASSEGAQLSTVPWRKWDGTSSVANSAVFRPGVSTSDIAAVPVRQSAPPLHPATSSRVYGQPSSVQPLGAGKSAASAAPVGRNTPLQHPFAASKVCRQPLSNGQPCAQSMYGWSNQNIPSTSSMFPVAQGQSSRGPTSGKVWHPSAAIKQNDPRKEEDSDETRLNMFRTARDELALQNSKNYGASHNSGPQISSYGCQKKSLGAKRGVFKKFTPPVKPTAEDDFGGQFGKMPNDEDSQQEVDERLKNIDPKMVELIRNEIMDIGAPVTWDDIAGLEFAKTTIQEAVVWPLLRPDIFTGLRRPPKGILLFGPPGTGKTLIGKCIASQSRSTFFSISASSLTSKWIGEGEKMVRTLFAVARCHQPSVVFIDEIDSLLSQRSDTEHESSRRMKTEFLVQLDGATTGEEDRILVVGATNRPQELDEAARRRLVKKLYVPLPEHKARCQIVWRLMSTERNNLTDSEVDEIARLTEGYSGADMKNLCQEASMGPIRSLGFSQIQQLRPEEVRPVSVEDFKAALTRVRASVSSNDLSTYVLWDKQYGSGGIAVS